MRLIDRDELIKHLKMCREESNGGTPIVDGVLTAVQCYVEDAPVVDAVPTNLIGVMYSALLDIWKNEIQLLNEYSIFGEHSNYEKLAFNNAAENAQNIDAIIGALEEMMA